MGEEEFHFLEIHHSTNHHLENRHQVEVDIHHHQTAEVVLDDGKQINSTLSSKKNEIPSLSKSSSSGGGGKSSSSIVLITVGLCQEDSPFKASLRGNSNS